MDITIGATLTGGESVTLTPAGVSPGKSILLAPGHTFLEPETIEFTSTPPRTTNSSAGVARTGMKISFAARQTEEGCCTVQAGAVIADLGIRWSLNQSEDLVDDVIDYLRGLVYSTDFVSAVKKGVLPTS